MKRLVLFGQGYFGALVYQACADNGLRPLLYTYSQSAARRQSDKTFLREGYPFRYINERKFDPSLIELTERDIVLCADWTKDFFHDTEPACPVYHIHPSLLPLYRGYGAVSAQFLRGVAISGISLYQENGQVDAGPLIFQEKIRINFNDYPADFLANCAKEVGKLALRLAKGEYMEPLDQPAEEGFYVQRSRQKYARLDLNANALYIYNHIRAYGEPYAGTDLSLAGKEIRVQRAGCEAWTGILGAPGSILSLTADGVEVACGEGSIVITHALYNGDAYSYAAVSELFD